MDLNTWENSMYSDADSDGRKLFSQLETKIVRADANPNSEVTGLIQYGRTAFGFDRNGELSEAVHHPVIRMLYFDPNFPEIGQKLLDQAMSDFGNEQKIYAFFHYFGMSACARHGKLHESQTHVETLLLRNGFIVEHENIYYSRVLSGQDVSESSVTLFWKSLSKGNCRSFTASINGQEVCWGQIHFLPQGNAAYLRWIFTDGSMQHQGIGTQAMKSLFSHLFSMGIRRFDTDTMLSNTVAQHYYENNGFTYEGITRSYYTK